VHVNAALRILPAEDDLLVIRTRSHEPIPLMLASIDAA
jgi:hypothetical protein